MLHALVSGFVKAKNAYLAIRKNDPLMLSTDFDLRFHLHRRSSPDQANNLCTDGRFSIALIDIALISGILCILSAFAGIFALADWIVRKIF